MLRVRVVGIIPREGVKRESLEQKAASSMYSGPKGVHILVLVIIQILYYPCC